MNRCNKTEVLLLTMSIISGVVKINDTDFLRTFSILISASNNETLTRKERHLLFTLPSVPVRARWAGGEGYACITSRGILGSCQSFRNCYPFFKFPPPFARYPVLNPYDSWVLGNYDTCSYYTDDGRQAHGVCCTNPISPQPVVSDDTEQNKVDLPPAQNIPTFGSWPPPVPTHPPNHTPATHPPSFGIQQPATTTMNPLFDPFSTTTKRKTTTWATKPPPFQRPTQPIFAAPAQTTTKRPSIIATTEPSYINEIGFDGGSCGAKNGFQVSSEIRIKF